MRVKERWRILDEFCQTIKPIARRNTPCRKITEVTKRIQQSLSIAIQE
jgi:hypothetical protein